MAFFFMWMAQDNVTVSRVRLWYISVAIHMYIMHNAQCTCVLHIAVHMCVMYKESGIKSIDPDHSLTHLDDDLDVTLKSTEHHIEFSLYQQQ